MVRADRAAGPAAGPAVGPAVGPAAPASWTIRAAVPADAAALAALDAAAGASSWADAAAYRGELARDDRHYLVATADPPPPPPHPAAPDTRDTRDAPAVVGVLGAALLADELHVMVLAVDPDRRRQGVGGRLLHALLAAAHHLDARGVTLEVRSTNAAALALYRRAGFTVAGRRVRYYPDGTDALVLWWYPHEPHEPHDPPGPTPAPDPPPSTEPC